MKENDVVCNIFAKVLHTINQAKNNETKQSLVDLMVAEVKANDIFRNSDFAGGLHDTLAEMVTQNKLVGLLDAKLHSPLDMAVLNNSEYMLGTLLELPFNNDVKSRTLDYAIALGTPEIVGKLISSGAILNSMDLEEKILLGLEKNKGNMVKLLVKADKDNDALDMVYLELAREKKAYAIDFLSRQAKAPITQEIMDRITSKEEYKPMRKQITQLFNNQADQKAARGIEYKKANLAKLMCDNN